jgi:hypothetical protein
MDGRLEVPCDAVRAETLERLLEALGLEATEHNWAG